MFLLSGVSFFVAMNHWARVGPNLLHGDLDIPEWLILFHAANIGTHSGKIQRIVLIKMIH